MTEEKLEELKLDLIDIVNPIGEVLEEFEAKFEEFKQNIHSKRKMACPDDVVIDEKGRVWRELVPGFMKPEGWTMSSAEVTAELEAKYGYLHN
jgi:hypothetical protein